MNERAEISLNWILRGMGEGENLLKEKNEKKS